MNYPELLQIIKHNGNPVTMSEQPGIHLRHDIDHDYVVALACGTMESLHGIRSTFFFLEETFCPYVANQLQDMGHEIGLHYRPDIREIERTLDRMRGFGIVVKGCSAHGFKDRVGPPDRIWDDHSMKDYGLEWEAYSRPRKWYLSDSGGVLWRVWQGMNQDFERIPIVVNLDIHKMIQNETQILVHPIWWARDFGFKKVVYAGKWKEITG